MNAFDLHRLPPGESEENGKIEKTGAWAWGTERNTHGGRKYRQTRFLVCTVISSQCLTTSGETSMRLCGFRGLRVVFE